MSSPGGAERAVRWLLSGRVQGVGFRWFAREAAEELGLAGTVANLPDGRVEIEVAGDPESLAAFRRRVEQGPPSGRVDRVEEHELDRPGGWRGFSIVHR